MEFKKVGVLGCGLMGAGIAQTAAMAGYETIVREVSDDFLAKGFAGIEKSLAKFAEKGTITADQQKEIRDRLKGTMSFEDLADCDIIIEASCENLKRNAKPISALISLQTGNLFAEHLLTFAPQMRPSLPERHSVYRHALFQSVPLMKLVESSHDPD